MEKYSRIKCCFNNLLYFLLYVDGVSYDVLVGLILLSHVAFLFVVRAEFLRLKDVSSYCSATQQLFRPFL